MDNKRYASQIRLAEIGLEGQNKLSSARVLCIGAGGLAASVIPYLVASGIGNITICDADVVEESNLNRQIWFSSQDIGRNKAVTLADKMLIQNPDIKINSITSYLNNENCHTIISGYDLVLDCSDNYQTKLLINDKCREFKIPWVYSSVLGFDGQAALFSNQNVDQKTPCLRCAINIVPHTNLSCKNSGVLGTSVNLVGSYQATMAIQALLGNFDLANQIWIFDLWSLDIQHFKIMYNSKCLHSSLENKNYTQYSVEDYSDSNLSQYKVIDIRDLYEWECGHIFNASHVSLGQIMTSPERYLNKDSRTLLYCNHQQLSMMAVENLRNLGYQAWWLKNGYLGYKKIKDKSILNKL